MKHLYKIICTMHSDDIYDFLADNGAEPWKPEKLSHGYLIGELLEFLDASPENAGLLEQWHAQYA